MMDSGYNQRNRRRFCDLIMTTFTVNLHFYNLSDILCMESQTLFEDIYYTTSSSDVCASCAILNIDHCIFYSVFKVRKRFVVAVYEFKYR